MNPLINDEQYEYYVEENKEKIEKRTFGDIFAFSLIGFFTLSAFIIGSWSSILLFTGNTASGGPIGFVFNKILTLNLV
jgi:hypothetical protein